jgi:hypothetical protein
MSTSASVVPRCVGEEESAARVIPRSARDEESAFPGFPTLIVAGLLTACAATADAPSSNIVTITLQATPRNAGTIGRAFLMAEGTGTRVLIEVSGVPPQVSTRPVHLYTYVYAGTCNPLAPQPAYALLDRVLAQSPTSSAIVPAGGPFTVSNTAPMPLEKFRAGPYAIVVKTSPADGDVAIFCGDVAGR